MATTYTDNNPSAGDGSRTEFRYTFPVIQTEDVKVSLNGVTQATTKYTVDNVSNPTHIDFNNTSIDSSVQETSGAPKSGVRVRVYRETTVGKTDGNEDPKAVFAAGSSIRAIDLNANQEQSLMAIHELQTRPIETEDIQGDAIVGSLIADDQINSEHYVDGSIDTQHIGADQITNALIADDQIDSEHYVDGSIDEQHLSNSAISSTKIADNAVTTTEILNGAVTRAKLEADAIDGTKLADNAVDSEHYTDGSIDREHLAADIIDSTKLADNAVNSEHYVDGSIDHEHLGNDIIDGSNIQDDVINSEHIAAGALDNEHYAAGSITSDKLNGATVVTNSEQAASTPNDTSFFTTAAAEARYFNASTGETIKDGQAFPDNDTTIATTAAINDRIIDLVDDVGGFVPIANETSFPTANPDVNGGAGTIVSVKAASTNLAPSGTTVTIANGRGSGLAVIITGVSATIPSGFGFLVETTTTDHTYAFHRLVPKATEVTTVAGKSTEIGRLGTAAAVEDMSILGTTDVVADMAILGTTDVVADMNTLGTADVVSDMNTLAVTSVVNNMDTVATNVANVNNVGGSISNVNTTAGSIANVNTVAGSIANVNTTAGSISNVNTTAGSISNVNTVASNISSVNNFFNVYRIGANNPTTSLDTGDLFFNTTSNSLKVYTGSAWVDGVTATGNFALKTGNTFTGSNIYNDNVKAIFGTGSDMEIFHYNGFGFITNTDGILHLRSVDGIKLQDQGGNEVFVNCIDNAAVELFYDNSKKLETTSGGVHVLGTLEGDNLKASNPGNNALLIQNPSNGIIGFGANNQTNQVTISTDGHLGIPSDTGRLRLGASEDLQIYHDGSHSYLKGTTGFTLVYGGSGVALHANSSDYALHAASNGATKLYYDNSKKLETSSTGTTTTGQVKVDVDTNLNSDTEYNGQDFGFLVGYDGGFNAGDEGNGICFAQQYANGDASIVRTGAIIGYKQQATGNFGGGLKFKTQKLGANPMGTALQLDQQQNVSLPNDNAELRIGASNDLQIYHDGSHSWIKNNTGNLYINPKGAEVGIVLIPDGAVELRHNDVKKFETNSGGCTLTGTLTTTAGITAGNNVSLGDNVRLRLGASNDLDLFHDGTDNHIIGGSPINVETGSGETMAKFITNSGVELYYDNSKKFETTSTGVSTTGTMFFDGGSDGSIYIRGAGSDIRFTNGSWTGNSTNAKIQQYNSYLYIFGGSNGIIFRENGTDRWLIDGSGHFIPNADSTYNIGSNSVRVANGYFDTLYGDGSNLTGISSVGGSTGVDFNDNVKARFGTGNDLEIYHDGSYNYILSPNSHTLIQESDLIQLRSVSNEKYFVGTLNGSVELYYDNDKKAQTFSHGFQVYGEMKLSSGTYGTTHFNYLGNGHNYFSQGDTNNTYFRNATGSIRTTIESSGNWLWADNIKVQLGSSGDLKIFHDGSNNYINSSNGNLYLQQSSQNKAIVKGGALSPGNENIDLGESGLRWQNVHAKRYHGDGVLQARIAYETVSTYSIYDSYGVSSLGDNGTGYSDVNFTTAYADNTYTINANGQQDAGGGGRFCTFKNPDSDGSHCEIEFRAFNNGLLDAVRICAMFSGDQP